MNHDSGKYRWASDTIKKIEAETAKGYLGMPDVLQQAVLALTGGLHLLIEDISGVGKTTLVRCLAAASGLDFGRIQFTPDLLPGDITGMTVWEPVQREFLYRSGPIHHQFIMADELNRSPARTQSALLEAMQEESVTVDGIMRKLPDPFFVAATQNPSWYAGTYALPESQLDRFGISMTPGFPASEVESLILGEFKDRKAAEGVGTVSSPEEIRELRQLISSAHVQKEVLDFAVAIARRTRSAEGFLSGLSIRGLQHLLRGAQAAAVREGRSFVIPEDLRMMAVPVMRHRLLLSPEARSRGEQVEKLITGLVAGIPVPAL